MDAVATTAQWHHATEAARNLLPAVMRLMIKREMTMEVIGRLLLSPNRTPPDSKGRPRKRWTPDVTLVSHKSLALHKVGV